MASSGDSVTTAIPYPVPSSANPAMARSTLVFGFFLPWLLPRKKFYRIGKTDLQKIIAKGQKENRQEQQDRICHRRN